MMIDYEVLERSPRVLLEAALVPAQGDRFQPTGFADLGAAEYTRPDSPDGKTGTRMLLVESAQSVANHLEKTCLNGDSPDIDPELAGLPYVAATLGRKDGTAAEIRTSSLVEAHRLASPYILKAPYRTATFGGILSSEMSYTAKGPLNWKRIYSALFKYDPNALIHGVFLSLLEGGRIKVPRAVTGFIEAQNVKEVVSGGVKNSPVDPKGELQVDGVAETERGVYSNVPYARIEYVAEKITAYFNFDMALVKGYGFPEPQRRLIIALSLLKVRRFLGGHLRLRTACDLRLHGEAKMTAPQGMVLPAEADLLADVKQLIHDCGTVFADPPVTELKTPVKLVTKKEKAKATAVAAGDGE